MTDRMKSRAAGRALRFLTGAALVFVVSRIMIGASAAHNLSIAVVVIVLLLFFGILHIVISKFVPRIHPCFGALLAMIPLVFVYALGDVAALGVLLFLGVSLLVAAVRADAGCEVMALPGMLLGSRTHLACIVFSPLDWAEEKYQGSKEESPPTQSG